MRYGVRKKRELVLWGILFMGLVLLYLLSSTDWIIKEKEAEVYPVSLIISDTSDDDYVWHSRWSWCAGKRQTVPGQ